jgi:hypothetical protein
MKPSIEFAFDIAPSTCLFHLRSLVKSQNKKVQQKRHSSKYLSAFLQAIRHQSRHPG